MASSIKSRILSGLFWKYAERCGVQGVTFIVTLVLARLLTPTNYGTIALVMVFIEILNVFVDSGLSLALVQKKDADNLDFSTVFSFNLVACTILYALLFASAPAIASFYENPILTEVVRELGLIVIVSGLRNVQQAYVSRHLLFRKFFFATFGATILSAALGISMALMGFGLYALVVQQLSNVTLGTLFLYLTVPCHPHLTFSHTRFRPLFAFGSRILAASLIHTTYMNLQQLFIGRLYAPADLAFYNQANKFPGAIANNINASIESVLLPALSRIQEERDRLKEMTRKSIKINSYIMWPLMILLTVIGEPLVRLLLTEKWLPLVPFLLPFCLSNAILPITTSNLNAIRALGRSDIILTLEIRKKGIGLLIILATVPISPIAMAYGLLLSSIITTFINAWPNRKLLDYKYEEQIKDIIPCLLVALASALATLSLRLLPLSDLYLLILQCIIYLVLYALLSKAIRLDSFLYLEATIKEVLVKHKKQKEPTK